MKQKRKLRILHVIQPTDGGSALHVRQLIERFDKKSFELHLAAPNHPDYIDLCQRVGVAFFPVPFRRSMNPLYDIRPLWAMYRICKKHKIDLIHLHSTKAGLVGRLAGKLAGARVIYTPHSPLYLQPQHPFKRSTVFWAERLTMGLVDKVVLVSRSEQRAVLRDHFVSSRKAIIIPNGLPVGRLIAVPKRRQVVLMVSRMEKQKRQQDLILAAPKILAAFPDAEVWLVGDGSRRRELEQLAKATGVAPKVQFLGKRDDVPELISKSAVVVQCSETEGMPYTVLEAMAGGRPVVGTNVEGIVDLVHDRQTGLLYALGNHEQLADRVAYLLGNPERLAAMGRAGRDLVKREYSLESMIERLQGLYEG